VERPSEGRLDVNNHESDEGPCLSRSDGQRAVHRQAGIKRTKESEALDEFTHKGIHGDHTFCFEFAEWHMNRPLIRAGRTKAVGGQIGTLTDAHAGVANQQKGIATQIVAAEELLLQELILLCCDSVCGRPIAPSWLP